MKLPQQGVLRPPWSAQVDMTFGFIFVTFAKNNRSKRHMLILNTINENHADFACFIEKRRLKCDFHDFRFWRPPGQAPEPETATKYASYSRFTIHSCRKALRFRASARFRKMRISRVPGGVWPENTIKYTEIHTLKWENSALRGPNLSSRGGKLGFEGSFGDVFLSTNVGSAEKRVSVLESQTPFFKTMHISLGVSPKMQKYEK